MPKVGQIKQKPAKYSLRFIDVQTEYDSADLLLGNYRIGQVILVRSEESKKFLQFLKSVGVTTVKDE